MIVWPSGAELREDVGEIGQGRDTVLGAGPGEAVEGGGVSCGVVGPGEEVVLPPERDVAQLLLAQIVIEADTSVVDEARQRDPVVEAIGGSFGEVAARRFARGGGDEPSFQLVEDRARSRPPQLGPVFVGRLARVSDVSTR